MSRYFVSGGGGFIGSHMVRRLLQAPEASVVVYDNFSSGRSWHLPEDDERLRIVRADLKDLAPLTEAIVGTEVVFHFASNPDIARAAREPDIDFWEGTYLMQNLLEAMRTAGVRRILYASGSGVYGDTGTTPVTEDYSPLEPISTYGASKLACEALLCPTATCLNWRASRFASPTWSAPGRPTASLTTSSAACSATQRSSKSWATARRANHIFMWMTFSTPCSCSMTGDGRASGSSTWPPRTMLPSARSPIWLPSSSTSQGVEYKFAGGTRGWKGDVPIVRFDTTKLRKLGWTNRRTSVEALRDAIDSMIVDARAGKFS